MSSLSLPFEVFVGARYLRSRSRNAFVSFITVISVLGIALSVAVLIVVLSVMNGFESEVRQRILSVLAHGSITGIDDRLTDWQWLQGLAAGEDDIVSTSPFVAGQGMLVGPDAAAGVGFRGILPADESRTSGVADLLREGSLDSLESRAYNVVLGYALAERLGVGLGDDVVLVVPTGGMTPAGMLPRSRRFSVSGILDAGMYEYDRNLAYMHLEDAARLQRLGADVTGISLAVTDPMRAESTVRRLARAYGGGVYVSDWTRQHANFFRSIELTRSIIFFILLIVVAVAAFNIVSTLVMVVREKRSDIAILRSMGASAGSVLGVFVTEGVLIGLVGAITGVIAGVVLSLNLGTLAALLEQLMQTRFVAPDVYFIDTLPSSMRTTDIASVAGIAFVLVVAATIYPAWKGARTNPAEALRHE